MLIDWFTVLAQIINFLVLVFLLKRFLYKPILNAIDEREAKLEKELKDAAESKAISAKEQLALKAQQDEIAAHRQELEIHAVADADAERARLIAVAKADAEKLRQKLLRSINDESAKIQEELTSQIHKRALTVAGRVLRDLGSGNLEDRMAESLTIRMEDLSDAEKASLSGQQVKVRSSVALSDEPRQKLESAIKSSLKVGAPVVFEVDPALIVGLELLSDGHRLEWSASSYLKELDLTLGDEEAEAPESAPKEAVGKA